METRDLLRGRPPGDREVVRREPRLVGAAERSGAGARDRVELSRGVLVTGAAGQLGEALREEFAGSVVAALTRADWDVTLPPPANVPAVDVVLHAAAWTDVDG